MKVVINGEAFDHDDDRVLMSEALWIEEVYGRRYVEYEAERGQGQAKALAVFACFVWKRAGREVDPADVLSGKVDFDLTEVVESITAHYAAQQAAAAEAVKDPTSGASPLTEPGGTATTPAATSGRSRKPSGSRPGTSEG